MELIDGVEYPTIELGGRKYTIYFTRGTMLYRLSKNGTGFEDFVGAKGFGATIDILHAVISDQGFVGGPEVLAELVTKEKKYQEVRLVIVEAAKKVFPPTQALAAGTADQPAAPEKPPAVQ